jgi:hypothetical protein
LVIIVLSRRHRGDRSCSDWGISPNLEAPMEVPPKKTEISKEEV